MILAGILFSAFNQNENAPRLETAQMILSQAFDNARAQAILKQSRARLIIYADEPTNEEEADKFLRYFGVVVETEPDSGIWQTALQGEYLPEGIYFIPEAGTATIDWSDERPRSFYKGQTMMLSFPNISTETENETNKFCFYEFKSTGRMSSWNNKVILAQGGISDLKPAFMRHIGELFRKHISHRAWQHP